MMEKVFTTENFEEEVLKADKPVLVDFYADWCGPCKMMAPMVEELAEELSDMLIVGKLNIDEHMDIAMNYRVMSIPTLIVFKNGEPAGKLVGVQDKEDVLEMIKMA
jgi:thioredoxin 1